MSQVLDLVPIWTLILGMAVFFYVLLDGFDLGVGILYGFAPDTASRNTIMNSIAPIWDGNETWLVLGGLGLLAAFPVAFAIIIPAIYFPILVMLLALVFRGVAFEFRFRDAEHKTFWDHRLLFRVGRRDICAGRGAGQLHSGIRGDRPGVLGQFLRFPDAVLHHDGSRSAIRLRPSRFWMVDPQDRSRHSKRRSPARPLLSTRGTGSDRRREHLDPNRKSSRRLTVVCLAEHVDICAGADRYCRSRDRYMAGSE
jgi:hypothetical protein